jgi:predicted  nucleic acid-binding Zn-ribbon protein
MDVIARERALEREIKRLEWHLGEAKDEANRMRRTAVRHAKDAASAHQQLRGAVEAARTVIAASEPCAVGNRHVLVEHLEMLAKACGLPPVRGQ